MAGINFMGFDSLPLISAAAVKAALTQRSRLDALAAVTPAQTSANSGQFIEANVANVSSKPPVFVLTLVSNKQTLQVESELPLPVGTRLTLQLPSNHSNNTALAQAQTTPLTYSSLTYSPGSLSTQALPATTNTQSTALNTTVIPTPQTNLLTTNGNQALSAAPIMLQVLHVALPAGSASPESSMIQQFLAARVPLLQSQVAPSTALSIETYQKPINTMQALLQTGTAQSKIPTAAIDHTQTANPASIKPVANTSPLVTLLNQLPKNNDLKAATAAVSSTLATADINSIAKTTAEKMPQEVITILQKWQQQLPTAKELSTPAGIATSVKNSGIQYEAQALKMVSSMLNSAPTNEANANTLFKSLWHKAANLTAPIKQAAQAQKSTMDAPIAAPNISQLLQTVKAKLEHSTSTPSSVNLSDTSTPHSLLNALLGSDYKAVVSRALIMWARVIQQADNAPITARSLPMQPASDVPETFRLLQSALAQTETEQAQRLNQNDNWQLNIPLFYKDGENTREVRMHLSKEEKDANSTEKTKSIHWRLRLHFNLTALGLLDVDLELQWPGLNATFWSTHASTLGLLNKELLPLRKTLTGMGVQVETLQAKHGQLPEISRNQISSRLIDTHS